MIKLEFTGMHSFFFPFFSQPKIVGYFSTVALIRY